MGAGQLAPKTIRPKTTRPTRNCLKATWHSFRRHPVLNDETTRLTSKKTVKQFGGKSKYKKI